jgi:hypothetical protein
MNIIQTCFEMKINQSISKWIFGTKFLIPTIKFNTGQFLNIDISQHTDLDARQHKY